MFVRGLYIGVFTRVEIEHNTLADTLLLDVYVCGDRAFLERVCGRDVVKLCSEPLQQREASFALEFVEALVLSHIGIREQHVHGQQLGECHNAEHYKVASTRPRGQMSLAQIIIVSD